MSHRFKILLKEPLQSGQFECPYCGELLDRMTVEKLIVREASCCPYCPSRAIPMGITDHPQRDLHEMDTDPEECGFDFLPGVAKHFDHAARGDTYFDLKHRRRA